MISSFSTSPTVYQKNILITTTTTSSKILTLMLMIVSIRVASYQTMDKGDYFTLSRTGCTHFVTNDEMEFVSLEKFEFEHKMFKAMLKVCRALRVRKGCFLPFVFFHSIMLHKVGSPTINAYSTPGKVGKNNIYSEVFLIPDKYEITESSFYSVMTIIYFSFIYNL